MGPLFTDPTTQKWAAWHPLSLLITDVEIIYVHEGTKVSYWPGIFQQQGKGDIILIHALMLFTPFILSKIKKHYMDALNFQLDLMGYSAMDQASIDYLQPLYKGELDFVHVIEEPHHKGYQAIRSCLIGDHGDYYHRKDHFELIKAQLNQLFLSAFENGYVVPNATLKATRKEGKIRDHHWLHNLHYQEELTIDHLQYLWLQRYSFYELFQKAYRCLLHGVPYSVSLEKGDRTSATFKSFSTWNCESIWVSTTCLPIVN